MTPWSWYAGHLDEHTYDLACDVKTREDAIKIACEVLEPGERFQIIEARSSAAMRYEGSDFIPFMRTRNHEVLFAWKEKQE